MKKTASVLLALLLCCSLMSTIVLAADTCIVAGTTELCGSFWVADDASNAMSLKDSVYEKVYSNVPVGDYQFKIVYNGQWIGAGSTGNDNVSFHVSSPCDVKITYNPVDNAIQYSGDGVGESMISVKDIYVAGEAVVSASAWVNGENWNAAADSNKTVKNTSGIYTITYSDIPAGEYKFKFAADKSWDHSWGGSFESFETESEAVHNGDNIVFTLSEQANVTLELDLSAMDSKGAGGKFRVRLNAKEDPTEPTNPTEPTDPTKATDPTNPTTTAPVSAEEYYVAGCKELCGVAWEANTPANKMTKGKDGIYTKVFKNVPKGSYQLKVTNGTWDKSWGGSGQDGNFEFVLNDTADVTVYFNPTTGTVSVNELKLSKYRVVGNTTELGNWDAAFEGGRMTEVSPGVFQKKFGKLPAGKYEYKITDGTWDNCWGDNGGNYKFELTEESSVIFTFNLQQGKAQTEIGPPMNDLSMLCFVAAALAAFMAVTVLALNKKKII